MRDFLDDKATIAVALMASRESPPFVRNPSPIRRRNHSGSRPASPKAAPKPKITYQARKVPKKSAQQVRSLPKNEEEYGRVQDLRWKIMKDRSRMNMRRGVNGELMTPWRGGRVEDEEWMEGENVYEEETNRQLEEHQWAAYDNITPELENPDEQNGPDEDVECGEVGEEELQGDYWEFKDGPTSCSTTL